MHIHIYVRLRVCVLCSSRERQQSQTVIVLCVPPVRHAQLAFAFLPPPSPLFPVRRVFASISTKICSMVESRVAMYSSIVVVPREIILRVVILADLS